MPEVVKIIIHERLRTNLSYMANTMVADDLATQGARASAAKVLDKFVWNILVSKPVGLQWKYTVYFTMIKYIFTEWGSLILHTVA